jgi:hypothetical protein
MTDIDSFESYYAERLWLLLPEFYRVDDTATDGSNGPLRELLNRIGAQAAVVRRSLDRLWEDQSIETCDDWVIPYIGDLLDTNLVNGLDKDGQRLDVAKTIHYRRRKGTLEVLEELGRDVSHGAISWDVHVVEAFRRLARTRHQLDPMVGPAAFPAAGPIENAELLRHEGLVGLLTGTPAGGYADLRSVHGALLANSPFDEYFHTADFRAGRGAVGHFGIPKLLVFIWRLWSFPVTGSTPVAIEGCTDQYTFDPTGRRVPLFLPTLGPEPDDFADTWTAASEWQVPGPISSSLETALSDVTGSFAPPEAPYPDLPPGVTAAPAAYGYAVSGATLAQVWPEVGVFSVAGNPPAPSSSFTVDYQYGFAGLAGAGPYDRRLIGALPSPPAGPSPHVFGGTGLDTALQAIGASGTVTVDDSLTYDKVAPVGTSAAPIKAVLIIAASKTPPIRPVVRLPGGSGPWVFTGGDEAELTIDGLFVSGCDVVLRGSFSTVTITGCTLDPGTGVPAGTSWPGGVPPAGASLLDMSVDGRSLSPTTLWIEADPSAPAGTSAISHLHLDHCVTGPIRTRFGGSVEDVTISDSIVQGLSVDAGPTYSTDDVYDPALLAAALTSDGPLAQKIFSELPAQAQSALKSYSSPAVVPQEVIDGLNQLVEGPDLYDPTVFATVVLSHNAAIMAKSHQTLAGAELAHFNRVLVDEAFPVALGTAAIAVADATISLARVTVIGRLAVHRLECSDSILDDFTVVDDTQDGCVRFSAYARGSRLPRQYESACIHDRAPLFTSTRFGQPGYGQLLDGVDQAIIGGAAGSISAGGDNGSEMGAFSLNLAPLKERGILTKYAEYMPLGLTPVIVHVT